MTISDAKAIHSTKAHEAEAGHISQASVSWRFPLLLLASVNLVTLIATLLIVQHLLYPPAASVDEREVLVQQAGAELSNMERSLKAQRRQADSIVEKLPSGVSESVAVELAAIDDALAEGLASSSKLSQALEHDPIAAEDRRSIENSNDFRATLGAGILVGFLVICVTWYGDRQTCKATREQQAKRREQIRLQAVMDSAADGIITVDERGIVQTFNHSAAVMFGYEPAEIIGKDVCMLVPSPHRERHGEYIDRFSMMTSRNDLRVVRDVIGVKKSGKQFPVQLTIGRVASRSVAGMEQHYIGVVRDGTELLARQNELREAVEAANTATRAKGEFLANMSHEIRTPMTAILGYAELLRETTQDQVASEFVETIERNGKYLLGLINDILDLSKIELGKFRIEQLKVEPMALLQDVISLMKLRATGKGLRLETELDANVPVWITSDSMRLRQILINLIGNAIKFTESGEVRVVVRWLQDEQENPQLRFDVIDSGIGIASDQLSKLFLPFHQADNSSSRKFGGTGLGLAISRRLAASLGGELTVESELHRGSTFSFTVDPGKYGHKASSIDTQIKVGGQDQNVQQDALAGRHVLLVEDGPDNQRLISHFLRKAGATVSLAENGLIGLQKCVEAMKANHPFDAILLDMQMPVLDGYQAAGKIRDAGYDRPVIALTAHSMAGDREKCINAGCDEYEPKPVQRAQLIAKLVDFIDRHEITNEDSTTPAGLARS